MTTVNSIGKNKKQSRIKVAGAKSTTAERKLIEQMSSQTIQCFLKSGCRWVTLNKCIRGREVPFQDLVDALTML